jgi:hypothetical protein
MSKITCHGCDGKGWTVFVVRERIRPFRENDRNDGAIMPGWTMISREYDICECPVCRGAGIVDRNQIIIGQVVDT